MVVMRCACTKSGGKVHRAKGKKKASHKKRKASGKKRGCRVAGVSVPKKVCGCVRREMKGVRGSKDMRKRLARNAVSQCKRGD
jgi:IS5 family transposase